MTRSSHRRLIARAALLTLAALLPSAAFAQGSTGVGRAANTPIQAVRGLIHTYYVGPKGRRMQVPAWFAGCAPSNRKVTACPVTPRFLSRLQHPDPRPAGCLGGCTLDIVSRSQNTTQYLAIRLVDNNGLVAHVNTRWSYTYNALRLTFLVKHAANGWRVADEYCTGRPATTIYRVPIKPCL